MPLIEWREELSVGIGRFDQDHQALVEMINDLFDAVQAGSGREALGSILDKLLEYTKCHMVTEEQILERHGYPDLIAHRLEHQKIGKQVVEVRSRYDAGASNAMCMEVMTLMKTWLIEHIRVTDKKYQSFLNAKGLH